MTREEAIKGWIIPALKNTWNEKKNTEILKALEQESCEDAISRQAVLDYIHRILNQGTGKKKSFEFIQKYVEKLPPVNPQLKMRRKGCIYEKTGNNSTYPCSHCGRCYTDKYRVESEDKNYERIQCRNKC